jgi:hypothetical protein
MTPQRIAEILEFPAVYDEDCPELTDEQRSRLRPKYPQKPEGYLDGFGRNTSEGFRQ